MTLAEMIKIFNILDIKSSLFGQSAGLLGVGLLYVFFITDLGLNFHGI
jgi:hypothetical protein